MINAALTQKLLTTLTEEDAAEAGIIIVTDAADPMIDAAAYVAANSTLIFSVIYELTSMVAEQEIPVPGESIALVMDDDGDIVHYGLVVEGENGQTMIRSKILGSRYVVDHPFSIAPITGAHTVSCYPNPF